MAADPRAALADEAVRWARRGSMEQAIAVYEDICAETKSDPYVVAHLGLHDRFFLLVHLLNRHDMLHPWLYARCREVEENPDGYLDLWAREHGKSTIVTFAGTIQDILNDPEVTFGIFSHTRPVAKAFLRQIKVEFETNVKLKSLYPEVLWANPGKEAPKWSEDDGIVVKRRTNPKESTVEAWGLVDGQPVGRHFTRLLYDDVVVPASVTSPEMIAKTTASWELSLNLGARGGSRRTVGTRYHQLDTYATIMERGSAQPRIYPATDDGTDGGKPVLLSPELLAEKRRDMGPYTFGAQMLLNPVADKVQGFKREWLRFWPAERWMALNRYILVDPAGERKKAQKKDPDYTVFTVIGLGADKNYYVIKWIRDRLNLTDRTRLLFDLHRTYRPLAVGYESYGKDSDIAHIQTEQDARTYRFDITELGGPMPKNDRIRRLVPLFEQGRIYLPERCNYIDREQNLRNLTAEFIEHEYTQFPVSRHDDMLDSMARILEPDLQCVWPKAMPEQVKPKWLRSLGGDEGGTWQST